MRLQLRSFVTLFPLLFSFFSWGQTAERSVQAGTSGYPETQAIDPFARSGPPQSPQNGNGTLGNMYSNTACGLNFTAASQRIGQRFSPPGVAQPAPFAISGIPACATVVKAFLWTEGSGNGAAQTATVNGPYGSANYPMTIVGQGPDKCWSYSGSYTYRADVTPTIGGNGTYNISGLLTSPPTSGSDMDGATLMVIYTDPTQTYQGTILIDDGAIVSTGTNTSYTMNYAAVCGTATGAQAFCGIGDLQMPVTSVTLNGTGTPVAWNWWNYCQTATTVSTGQTSSNFSVVSPGDCYNLCFTGLYYRTTCVACTSTPLTLNMSSTGASCSACNGTATVSVSPAGSYTYSWSPSGGTGTTASGLCAGTYTVTVTSSCGTSTATVVVPSIGGSLTLANAGQTNVSCNGGCNGTATVSVTTGTGPFTYSWSPSGGTGTTASGLCAGTYTCTVTDAGGCTGAQVFTITQPPALTATPSQTNVSCNGGCNGTATVSASGGTPGYTYSWTPSGGTGANAASLCAGNYTCTITDANGCFTTQSFNITQPPALTATQSQTNVSCNGGCNGTATVSASGGTPGYTYSWTPSGGTGASASSLCAGNYTCTITDANGCSTTRSFSITQPPALTATQSQTNINCNGGCNGTATVVASGGNPAYTYAWTPSGGTGATTSGRCAGNYTCTITDANGCSLTQAFSITQPTAISILPSQVNVSCNGGANGSATVAVSGGTPGYTYAWAPSGGTGASATGLAAGNYTCTVTDANACTATQSFSITQPTPLTAGTSSSPATCGNPNGSATVTPSGGTVPYTYAWSPSGGNAATATGLLAGPFSCLITDANSCTFTQTVTVTNAGSPTAAISSSTNVSCFGGNTGAATVTASGGTGPYTYAWTPSGGTGATGTTLSAGNYTVTVSDANACTAIATITITEPPLLSASVSSTPVLCNGGSTGTATVLASGGVSTYTYSWSPIGGTGTTAANLPAGSYTATVTDANGCTTTASTVVTQPSALTATSSQVDELCNGGNTASATVTPSGATSPYTYAWSPSGGNAASASALTAGAYTCLVTDANNCTFTVSVTITQPSAISLTVSAVQSTCGNANGQASVVATGGTGAYTYSWTPSGGTAATATGLSAATYTVTVTDANVCSATATVTVTNAGSPTAAITSSNNVSCFGGNNGDATVTPGAGTAPYTFAWSPSGGTGATGTALTAGSYTVTVSDANGCTATDSVIITEPSQLTASVSFTPVLCNAGSTGTATTLASGGIASYSYAWTPIGGSSVTAMNLPAGNYTCTITDANGCTTTASTTVTEPSALTATASQVDELCNGGATASATVTPAGATAPYVYAWSPSGGNAATASALTAGSYTCTITDANACSTTQSFTITEPSAVLVSATETDAHCNQQDGAASATASGGTGTISFSWSLPSSGPSISNVSAGTYTVIATDANGCTGTTTTTINNLNGVNASLVSVTNVACFGQSTGQVVVTQTGGNPQYIYNWTPNVTANDTATNLPAGNYQVTVVDANGCTSTVTATVTQPPALTISAAANPGSVCTGTGVTMSATTAGGNPTLNVVWMPGNLSGNSQTIIPSSSGTYTATVTDANGCTATASTSVTLFPMPLAALAADTLSGCAPVCVNFSDLSTITSPANITFWNWDFGDGNTSNQQNPSHCYANAGTYSVVLTVKSSDGCTQTVTMTNYITVFANPVAAFGASPQPTSLVNPQIFFTDSSTNAVSWSWSFGDLLNSTSTLQNPSFIYPDATCYQAALTVTSPDGCTDLTSREVCIAPDVAIYVPNAFTPNGDSKNETFYPSGTGLDPNQFEMWIFDRWGNMIYNTKDLSKGWDGRVQGHPDIAQQDTYVWRIKVKDLTGAEHDLLGRVTLIK